MVLRKLKYACYVVLTVVSAGYILIAFIFADAGATELKLYPETCNKKYTNPLRVKLGNHVFDLLYDPLLIIQNNPTSDGLISTNQCQKSNDSPIEATFIKFSPKKITEQFRRPTTREKWDQFVPLIALYHNPDSRPSLQAPYEIVKKRLDDRKITLSDLPKERNFYILEGIKKSDPTFYIAADKAFVTPSGDPVTLFCGSAFGKDSPVVDCATRLSWKKGITLYIGNISNTHVHFDDWKNFYSSVLKYVEAMEIKPSITNFLKGD